MGNRKSSDRDSTGCSLEYKHYMTNGKEFGVRFWGCFVGDNDYDDNEEYDDCIVILFHYY